TFNQRSQASSRAGGGSCWWGAATTAGRGGGVSPARSSATTSALQPVSAVGEKSAHGVCASPLGAGQGLGNRGKAVVVCSGASGRAARTDRDGAARGDRTTITAWVLAIAWRMSSVKRSPASTLRRFSHWVYPSAASLAANASTNGVSTRE